MTSSNEPSGMERFGMFSLRYTDEWRSTTGAMGLIGLDLSGGWGVRIPVSESEEPALWDAWLSRMVEGESVRFGDRIGFHLWIYAEIPEVWQNTSQPYIDGLARRIRDLLRAESRQSTGTPPMTRSSRDVGFGAAVIGCADDRSFKELIYEAFISAASRLNAPENVPPDTIYSTEMERILREGSIRSVYQPLYHLRDGNVFGYEALTRCPPDSPFDGPLSLFRYAEQEGYALALDRLARETAIRSCPLLGPKQKIFINVNSAIMKDPHFVSGQTRHWLALRGLHPGQVVFELTERSSIDDFEEAKRILDHYRVQGYQIAIDDAGAGYSSLQAIVELRPDYIKLDRSLVQNADRDEIKQHMLRTFVRFAKRMRIRTVAEGIERPEEFDLVRRMGIDFGQGYLIGKPSEQPVSAYAWEVPNG
ncbi:MAG: hypothetical protein JWR03_75 [Cohnella sp.]|jgi:EAL domain-containing protein (putative c-di-GMP-specific phosphodiesterase class I)|nr:hypothetical protein [Cohnella sp.]